MTRPTQMAAPLMMEDRFARRISYVRMSITDRCTMRCLYCMGEDMQFMVRSARLDAAEFLILGRHFVSRGVRSIRITGGEPLSRPDFADIAQGLGTLLGHGLEELTLSTNGLQLAACAAAVRRAGIKRINISLDSLDPQRFRRITGGGDLHAVLAGISAARDAGLTIKINMVALPDNQDELPAMLDWCAGQGHALSLIEHMPVGETRLDQGRNFVAMDDFLASVGGRAALSPLQHETPGPARYFRHIGYPGLQLGLIAAISHSFCASCNRVRLSADGLLHLCLGQERAIDLKAPLRSGNPAHIDAALDAAMGRKPKEHGFVQAMQANSAHEELRVKRHMNATGG